MAIIPPEVVEILTLFSTTVSTLYLFRNAMRPIVRLSLPTHPNQNSYSFEIALREGEIDTGSGYGPEPNYVKRTVRFLYATVTNKGLSEAQDCVCYATLTKTIPTFQRLSWRHWSSTVEGDFIGVSKEEFVAKLRTEYLNVPLMRLSRNVPRDLDLFIIFEDGSVYALREGQADPITNTPYEGVLELRLSWNKAVLGHTARTKVQIDNQGNLALQTLDC